MLSFRAKGFTTTELLMVMVLIAILAALAMPHLGRWLDIVRVNAAARNLASDMQLSRMRAIAQNTRYKMSFDPTTEAYAVQKDVDGTWQTVGAPRRLPEGVDLTEASRNAIYFQPLGLTPGSNATITLENAHGRRKVVLSSAGRIRIQKE